MFSSTWGNRSVHVRHSFQEGGLTSSCLSHFIEVFLDENRTFQSASGRFAWAAIAVPLRLRRLCILLLLDANEHLGEKETF